MSRTPLLNLLWRAGYFCGRTFTAVTGERVLVVTRGEAGDEQGTWYAAEIVADGERRRGAVAVGDEVQVPDGAVLRLVEGYAPPVLDTRDRLVPQISHSIDPALVERYDDLLVGARECGCAGHIASMSELHRISLYTRLAVERLRRKTRRITDIFERTDSDWNQTFHILLFRAMGGDRNREAFVELAERATAMTVSREKSSLLRVEALLLGTAGFLFSAPDKDDYTLKLEDEARHLSAKYSIVPLKPAVWNLAKLYPANHPAVRLAEIAALLCKKDFMFDGVLKCRTSDDIERLFAIEASDYWRTHYTPSGVPSAPSPKSIGRAKARLVGINLAVPLMFAYGKETGNEELCERALDLLATIPPEKNRLLAGWYEGGCSPESSFESQALLELEGEYCSAGRCADCPIGRNEIKKAISDYAYK